jgi:hypothetical protein
MKWKVPKLWEGSTAIIIGGGPSMLKQFNVPDSIIQDVYAGKIQPSAYSPYLEQIHKSHVIAVNVAYKIGTWIDVVFFGDPSTWQEDKANLVQFKGLRVTCAKELDNDTRLKWLQRDPRKRHGISTNPEMVSWNNNSGAAAINLAVHMGAKRIILLGFDMKLDKEKNQHWHKFYSTSEKQIASAFRRHLTGFREIKQDADQLGIEIINANPDSAITQFPRMNFKDIKL